MASTLLHGTLPEELQPSPDIFSPNGRAETYVQEGAVKELPYQEDSPRFFLPRSCKYSLELGEAAGFGLEKEPHYSKHFI